MISLPPGVVVNYSVKIIVSSLTIELFEWLRDVGARVWVETKSYDRKGRAREEPVVQFGRAKPSYHLQDGSDNVMLNFSSEDAGTALALLMKFSDIVISHNMREVENYVY